MKNFIVILLLLFTGCAHTITLTSMQLKDEALEACKDKPEVDAQRLICAWVYIKRTCIIHDYDNKMCGSIGDK